jgi:hypothetical protein
MAVEAWGTGRVDFSDNVESSVIPIIRSYQLNAYASQDFTLAAGATSDYVIPMTFSPDAACHFIAAIEVSVDKNVLIGVSIYTNVSLCFGTEYGYQQVIINYLQLLGLSNATARITNYSDFPVNGSYFHHGVQGTEKIMPIAHY